MPPHANGGKTGAKPLGTQSYQAREPVKLTNANGGETGRSPQARGNGMPLHANGGETERSPLAPKVIRRVSL